MLNTSLAQINQLPTLLTKSQLNTIITNKDGTPDFLTINILWDSLRSWFSPMKQYQSNGNVIQIKKLKTQGVYVSAEQLSKTHGVSKRTTTRKLAKLESLGFIQRSFRHKQTSTTKSYNQRCIYVLKYTPYFFNPYGVDMEEIKEITPQTNANYIEEKYNVVFASKTKQTKALRTRGGIDTRVSTKELIEPFNILKDRSNESTFSENSNSLILQPETSNLVETENEVVAEEGGKEATIHPLKPDTAQHSIKPANQRKKLTKAEYRAKRGKVLHFRQYDEPKSLADHYPLSAEDVSLLQSKSGREFGLKAQNQILQAMSNKPKLLGHTFPSKASFIAYMSKALASEKRNAVQINNTDFKIKANLTQEQLVEYTTLTQREAYLSDVEDRAITHRSDETQFRAKLVGTLGERSYDILPHLVRIEKKDEVFELYLNKTLELTKQTKDAILKEANAVDGYKGVERLEFVSPQKEISVEKWSMADTATAISNNIQPKPLELPQGLWGQVSKELISEYGIDIYRNWFKKLTATVDENMKTIELKASSEFVKDWIVDKYENTMAQIVNTMGFELRVAR
jgi:hypothetical protein